MYTINRVYQIYLNNRYLYYYYSFLGEHLILADLIRWRWTKLHSDGPVYTDSTVPITRGCSYLLDVSTDKVALIRIRNKHWTLLLENRWATGLLQELLCTINVHCRSTSHDDRRRQKCLQTTTNELPDTKRNSGSLFICI